MIRTSKMTTKFTNETKQNNLINFINEYKNVVDFYINKIWNELDPTSYTTPKFVSTVNYETEFLTQRAVKCAATQACGMVNAATTQARQYIYVINLLKSQNKETKILEDKLNKLKIVKPTTPNNFKCEINSICCDLLIRKNKFWFLQLKSIGKNFGKIRIPVKPHRQTLKWFKQGKLLNSFLISKDFIDVRFFIDDQDPKTIGEIVGLDQGIVSCVTLSDGQTSQDDQHGWNLSKILNKLCNKQKGSKGFKRVAAHRKNYINWTINQLNLTKIKQINLEKIKDLRLGKVVDKLRSHWTYTLISDKLKRLCEEQKVFVKEQSCIYRSQRCNVCGLVRKDQRNGKLYSCNNGCGNVVDSDLNASLNHVVDLPSVDHLRHLRLNLVGFYWNITGIFDLNGKEFTVPNT